MSPTKLNYFPTPQGAFYAMRNRRALMEKARVGVTARVPLAGYVPDLPPHIAGVGGARDSANCIIRTRQQRGDFLTHVDGYATLDSANSPISATAGVGMGEYLTSAGVAVPVMIWAGAGGGADIVVATYGTTGLFTVRTKGGHVGTDPEGDRDVLWDTCAYQFGAPTRTYSAHAAITTPIMLAAGGDETGPTQPVLMYPGDGAAVTQYDELWENAFVALTGAGAAVQYPFLAKSLEPFDGRVHFFNTKEGTINNHCRWRWTAVGTADPANNIVGSGFLDLKEFTRRGLRIESIGDDLVALYLEDGTALGYKTGRVTDAYRYRVVSKRRGLLGTHAVTPIGANLHFGIFDDGWWFMDSAGRFKEAGIFRAPESSGKDIEIHKWHDTFYDQLDISRRHRIVVAYDNQRYVHVTFPRLGDDTDKNGGWWIYDLHTDTVWPQTGIDVTYIGGVDRLIKVGETYGDFVGIPYDDPSVASRTYGSFAPITGLRALTHMSSVGVVSGWRNDLTTRNGVPVSAYYLTHDLPVQDDEAMMQTLQRCGVEYMNVGGPGCSIEGLINGGSSSQNQTIAFNEGGLNSMNTGYANFHLRSSHHALRLGMTAPFAVRSYRPEFLLDIGDDKQGSQT